MSESLRQSDVQAVRVGRRLWHVVVDGRAGCGTRPDVPTPLDLAGARPAVQVVERVRCQRRGCQNRWPVTQEEETG
jgi:hypothetical protein